MILHRLYELAEREGLLEELAFERLPVPYIVMLAEDGALLGIHERRDPIELPPKKDGERRTKPGRGNELVAPRAHGNTANKGFARFFVDTLPRVLPWNDDAKSAASRETFWRQIGQAADETGDPALNAVRAFGRRLVEDDALAAQVRSELERRKPAAGDRCTFAWSPDEGVTLVERPAVRRWYQEFFARVSQERQQDLVEGFCQVTGQRGPLPRSHGTTISGVPGGLPQGVSVVSFDKAAFESYGLEKAVNSGIGVRAAEGYTRALAALVANKIPEVPKSSLRLGNVLFVFWTRRKRDVNDIMQLLAADEQEVAHVLSAAYAGQVPEATDPADFYCLALSGNAARAILRDYLEEPVARAKDSLRQWFADLQIFDVFENRVRANFPLWMLAQATVRAGDDPPPDLPTSLLAAALDRNRLLPDHVLAACLRRIRVESGANQFAPARMALIRLVLNRSHHSREKIMHEKLDEGELDPGYVCGRLFACLAYIQAFERDPGNPQKHGYGQAAPIVGSYYGAASMSPRSVFGALLRQNNHRMRKIQEMADHKYGGFVNNRNREIEECCRRLGDPNAWAPDFPPMLTLPQQARFALGYYHQRAHYRETARAKSAEQQQQE